MRKGQKTINHLENYDYWSMKRDPLWMNGEGIGLIKGRPLDMRAMKEYVFFRNMMKMGWM